MTNIRIGWLAYITGVSEVEDPLLSLRYHITQIFEETSLVADNNLVIYPSNPQISSNYLSSLPNKPNSPNYFH